MKQNIALCSGQGSFVPGKGKTLYDTNLLYRQSIDEMSDRFNISIPNLCWGLTCAKTKNNVLLSHIALWSVSYSLFQLLLDSGINIELLIGHSLGEVFCYFLSGAVDIDDVVNLIKIRGQLFLDNSLKSDSDMVVLVGDTNSIKTIINLVKEVEDIFPANYNSENQVVFSVSKKRINEFITLSKEYGIKKAVCLNINNGCHSPFVKSIGEKMQEKIKKIIFKKPVVPVLSAVNSTVLREGEQIKEVFLSHIISPVNWHDTVNVLNKLYPEKKIYNLSFSSVSKNLVRVNTADNVEFVDF